MIEVIDGRVRHKGISFGVGETLTLSDDEEQRLIGLRVAKSIETKDKADSNKGQDLDLKTGTDTGGPNTSIPLV